MSILSLVSTIPSIIAVALRNEDVVVGIRAIASSPLVGVLEAAAEKMFPKVAPALRLNAVTPFITPDPPWLANLPLVIAIMAFLLAFGLSHIRAERARAAPSTSPHVRRQPRGM